MYKYLARLKVTSWAFFFNCKERGKGACLFTTDSMGWELQQHHRLCFFKFELLLKSPLQKMLNFSSLSSVCSIAQKWQETQDSRLIEADKKWTLHHNNSKWNPTQATDHSYCSFFTWECAGCVQCVLGNRFNFYWTVNVNAIKNKKKKKKKHSFTPILILFASKIVTNKK